jgi:hypothetical protein
VATIAEHGSEAVAVVVQGKLLTDGEGGNRLDRKSITAQIKGQRAAGAAS